MELKQLDKATKIYSDIQKLDSEIIEIERLASLVANGDVKSSFELKVVDKKKQEEESQKLEFDEDGDIIRPNCRVFTYEKFDTMPSFLQGFFNKESKSKSANTLSSNISESTTLQILAVLLNDKKKRRFDLINKLKSFGVNA